MNKRLIETIAVSGLKKSDIAKTIGIYKSRLSEYLKGRYQLKRDKLDALAAVLHKKPEWLFGKGYKNE